MMDRVIIFLTSVVNLIIAVINLITVLLIRQKKKKNPHRRNR